MAAFRIRLVHGARLAADRAVLEQVRAILAEQLPGLPPEEVQGLEARLVPGAHPGYRSFLMVAENGRARVLGFALSILFLDAKSLFLDYLCAAPGGTGGGVGGALYEAVRELARGLGARALFLEASPDDPALCPDPAQRRVNARRLRFYERLGARPVAGTAYETPHREGAECPPYLLADPLVLRRPIRRATLAATVEAVFRHKYPDILTPAYRKRVLGSLSEDPVRLAPPRSLTDAGAHTEPDAPPWPALAMVRTQGHAIHHVPDRGYVEAPVRVETIAKALAAAGLVRDIPARRHAESRITAVHDPDFVAYLKRVCANLPPDRSVYPYVFPLRNAARPPRELAVRAGYYCVDTFTPLNSAAHGAARRAVDCALTAAELVLGGERLAYALVRPPGHHAERRAFGGFCYFNNAAIAAQRLSPEGRVALLDIDFHHGNGGQDIFYRRAGVLTVSLHGHPRFAYPYFSGFEDERGEGPGLGANRNFPLPENLETARYLETLRAALELVQAFKPEFLVLALGLDTAKEDPTGTWGLRARDFRVAGSMVGGLGLPVLAVQEGGYRVRTLGANARAFCGGLAEHAL